MASDGSGYEWLFTDNVTNTERLYGVPNEWPYVKDGIHRYVVDGVKAAVNPRSRRHQGGRALPIGRSRPRPKSRSACGSSPKRNHPGKSSENPFDTSWPQERTRATSSMPRSFLRNWDCRSD